MERRRFIAATGIGATASVAGCSALLASNPEVAYEYEYEGFVGGGMQPAIVVTGSMENKGGGEASEIQFRALVKDGDEILKEDRKSYTQLSVDEEQEFWFKFELSQDTSGDVEDTEVQMRIGGDGDWTTPSY